MRVKDYPEKDDAKRVWLSSDETQRWIDQAEDSIQKMAFLLMARCGLRRGEVIQIKPVDIRKTDRGHVVRMQGSYSKSSETRAPPAPPELVTIAETVSDMEGVEPDSALVGHDPDDEGRRPYNDNTIRSWVVRASERMHAETGDDGWLYVTPHDLRRTWGRRLVEMGVEDSVVMEWGGWRDYPTFFNHYLTELSPDALSDERKKVDYLEGKAEPEGRSTIAGGRGTGGGMSGPPNGYG